MELRTRARERIKDGRLPCAHGPLLASYDGVESCALCGGRIDTRELAYEVALPRRGDSKMLVLLHPRCHEAWQSECSDRADRTLG